MIKKTQKGFTLIELLVVVAIIALLSSIILASISTARSKARDAKRLSDIDQIRIALELYRDKNGQYPDSVPGGSGCWWSWEGGNTLNGQNSFLTALSPYIKAPLESYWSGCIYRYVRFNETWGCGYGTVALLYVELENKAPDVGRAPACVVNASWGEAAPTDPNGYLLILKENK